MAARRRKTLCEEHFPDGWEGIDKQHDMVGARVSGVGCEHGTFNRADTEPKDPDPNDPPKDPDPKDPDGGKGGGE